MLDIIPSRSSGLNNGSCIKLQLNKMTSYEEKRGEGGGIKSRKEEKTYHLSSEFCESGMSLEKNPSVFWPGPASIYPT